MHIHAKAVVLSLAITAMTACAAESDPVPAGSSATTSAAAPAFAGDATDALALADPGGSKNVDHLIRAYQKAIEKLDRPDDWILLGRAWIRKARETHDPGYYLHARACAERMLERVPEDALALGLLGQVQLNDHDFAGALTTAKSVLARSPEDLPSLGNESDALLELGRYQEAVTVTTKMTELKPSLPSYARASYLSFLFGELDAARTSARMAIDAGNDPTDPEPRCYAMVQAGHLFFHEGDYAGADAGYLKALGECPDYPHALLGRGKVALALGKASDAVDALERAAKQSRSIEALWRLGDAKLARGDREGAEAAYATLIERGKVEDRRTVAQFLGAKNRDVELAVELARSEMKERPGIYTEDALAWALYRKGHIDEAYVLSQRALRLKTPDAMLEYHAGAIAIAKGKTEEGRRLVEAALARSPGFDPSVVEEARTLLSKSS